MISKEKSSVNQKRGGTRRWILVVFLLFPVALVACSSPREVENGANVQDLRGRWEAAFSFEDKAGESPTQVVFIIQDLGSQPDDTNTYWGNGCMQTLSSNAYAPLSLEVTDAQNGDFEVHILSTVVDSFEESYVIRLDGFLENGGDGVQDDSGNGALLTGFSEGSWSASHLDQDAPTCPPVDLDTLMFEGDVYVHRDLAQTPPFDITLFNTTSRIVSSAVLVERPDGTVERVTAYKDIFSPDVDFVNVFQYLITLEGTPEVGEPYKFTLLDVLGNPIPGAEITDYFYGCVQDVARNLNVERLDGEDVLLTWDKVNIIANEFDPPNGLGQYQVNLFPFDTGGPTLYGAHQIGSSSHQMPWIHFVPDSPGIPDGSDEGISLSELPDGTYEINVTAFSVSSPNTEGHGLECAIWDSNENIIMEKAGGDLNFSGK